MVKHDFSLEALGVFEKSLHQLRPLHAVNVGGPVVDIGCSHQLPTLCDAGYQHRFKVGAGGVNGG